MEALYKAAGTTRQAIHQWRQASPVQLEQTPEHLVLELALKIRKEYLPGSSARELYAFIRKHDEYSQLLKGWGKHRFERLCLENNFRIIFKRWIPKTTQRGGFIFPNLIERKQIRGINLIWVSDISYIYSVSGKLIGYSTSLIDVYSRYLLGLQFSKTMRACETSIPVCQQAFRTRKIKKFENLIFHSDGGKQYIEKQLLSTFNKKGIKSSMARNCLENAFAEAFNDTLKNHILPEFKLKSFDELKKQQKFVKKAYNHYKVHTGIKRFTPIEYEQHIQNVKTCQRTAVKIKEIL